jgi:hypothetical protein
MVKPPGSRMSVPARTVALVNGWEPAKFTDFYNSSPPHQLLLELFFPAKFSVVFNREPRLMTQPAIGNKKKKKKRPVSPVV